MTKIEKMEELRRSARGGDRQHSALAADKGLRVEVDALQAEINEIKNGINGRTDGQR